MEFGARLSAIWEQGSPYERGDLPKMRVASANVRDAWGNVRDASGNARDAWANARDARANVPESWSNAREASGNPTQLSRRGGKARPTRSRSGSSRASRTADGGKRARDTPGRRARWVRAGARRPWSHAHCPRPGMHWARPGLRWARAGARWPKTTGRGCYIEGGSGLRGEGTTSQAEESTWRTNRISTDSTSRSP